MKREPSEQTAEKEAAHTLLLEARKALRSGRIGEAERLVAEAKRKGASAALLQDLRTNIKLAVQKREKHAHLAAWGGFFLAIPCYILLSFFRTPQQGVRLWAALAFLLIPLLTGFVSGRLAGAERSPMRRFWPAFRACFLAFFFYASVNLMILHSRVGSAGNSTGVFFVGLVVTLTYSILAGLAAGISAAKLTWPGRKPVPAV